LVWATTTARRAGLLAVSGATGKVLWWFAHAVPEDGDGHLVGHLVELRSPPAVVQRGTGKAPLLVLTAVCDRHDGDEHRRAVSVMAVDGASGKLVWKHEPEDDRSWSENPFPHPAQVVRLGRQREAVASLEGQRLVLLDPSTGRRLGPDQD